MSHPQRLGKYQITEVLGEGAMGVVYKGFDPDIRRTVALKTIRASFNQGGEGVSAAARFRNEAQAAGRLSHPGIVAVYDFGQHDDTAFIAMEFVEGHTLAHYLANKVRFTDDDNAKLFLVLNVCAIPGALVFGRLWETQGLPALLRRLAEDRRVGFDVERAVFALALQRLCAPGGPFARNLFTHRHRLPGTGVARVAVQLRATK